MAKTKPSDASTPSSRLDRVARDVNRTFLHGMRVKTSTGAVKPAMVVTGQQIPVELPPSGGLTFTFDAGTTSRDVVVDRADAAASEEAMRDALAKPDTYLRLAVDREIPTWVFHQREFTLPTGDVPETAATLSDGELTVKRLSDGALQEIQRLGETCDVSLLQMDPATQSETPLPATWQPAILLRFPLQALTQSELFELTGTPQGDRFYLDRLNLLPGDPGQTAGVKSVVLLLQRKDGGRTRARTWTIARTNLTEEARPGVSMFARAISEPSFPFVASEADPLDTLRLLQMASITNAGGYFLRTRDAVEPEALIVCVLLDAGTSTIREAVRVPLAANAVAYPVQHAPDVARIEGFRSVDITPFVPPGSISFGWTRTEPAIKQNDEERFGFGTISLVDFQATDAAGRRVEDEISGIAISPLQSLSGEHILADNARTLAADRPRTAPASSAAMRAMPLGAVQQARAVRAAGSDGAEVRHYRASLRCHGRAESPYAPLADPARRTVTLAPGFRDVFGNSFPAVAGALETRSLFYTDALISPREWPGIRFSLYSTTEVGRPVLHLEAVYTPVDEDGDKMSRFLRLVEIRQQLQGARSDVQVALEARPLLQGERAITQELIAWLDTIIALERPEGPAGPRPLPKTFSYACDVTVLAAPAQVAPRLIVSRRDRSLLPTTSDLPSNEILRDTIAGQIAQTTAPVDPTVGPTGELFARADPDRKDEFRTVAKAYAEHLSAAYDSQIGFGRNQLNQHELWLLPNSLLPRPDGASAWTFATARPLRKTLLTEQLQVPSFTKPTGVEPHWQEFALEDKHFVDQDVDEVARAAFRTIEQLALQPTMLTDPTLRDAARDALSSKDLIARQLAASEGINASPYLIPLVEQTGGTLEPRGLKRLASDAFLRNLNAFYAIDTIVQLPLRQLLDDRYFAACEAKVESLFAAPAPTPGTLDPERSFPSFSDVLLKGGERKVTLLYHVPPGTRDPNVDVSPIPGKANAMRMHITHVQRKADVRATEIATPFSRGAWLQLAMPLELAWTGLGGVVPVAVRRFPDKPILEAVTLSSATITPPLTEASVPLLARWGWAITFVAEGLASDRVRLTVRYNEPNSGDFAAMRLAASREWQPVSLLHCLIVLKQIGEHWLLIPSEKRLPMVAHVLRHLPTFLDDSVVARAALASEPALDRIDVAFPANLPATRVLLRSDIMTTVDISDSTIGSELTKRRRVALKAEANRNTASLVAPSTGGRGPAHNARPSLSLVRNERIGQTGPRLDPRLIYECPAVEAPRERWALNALTTPLTYQAAAGQTFQGALGSFFEALFARTDFALVGVEVAASLECRRGELTISTPYSIIPADITPGSAGALADTVFTKAQQLLGGAGGSVIPPPEVSAPAVRLRLKVSTRTGQRPRTLMEIDAIDFPIKTTNSDLVTGDADDDGAGGDGRW
jgi:hypothetical protein